MMIARIEGGLGNQMFIYAYARALALRCGHELALDIYNSGFEGSDPFGRSYQLKHFPIVVRLALSNEVKKFGRSNKSFYHLRKLSHFLPFEWKPIIEEPRCFNRKFISFKPSNNAYIVGYWQDERYFEGYEKQIATELSLDSLKVQIDPYDLEKVKSPKNIVLHVRRDKFPYRLQPSFYIEALKRLISGQERPRLLVFGDDPGWVAAAFKLPYELEFVSRVGPNQDLHDFYLMSHARRLVISNSTFSWWAAWFAQRKGTRVVAPEAWGYPARPSTKWELISASYYKFE